MDNEAKIPAWSDVLLAIQKIAPEDGSGFTVENVCSEMRKEFLVDPKRIGQWVSKLVEWGYVARGEFAEPSGRGRPSRLYRVLPRGLKPLSGRQSHLERLMNAIYEVQHIPGNDVRELHRQLSLLYKLRDEIEEEIANRFQRKGN